MSADHEKSVLHPAGARWTGWRRIQGLGLVRAGMHQQSRAWGGIKRHPALTAEHCVRPQGDAGQQGGGA